MEETKGSFCFWVLIILLVLTLTGLYSWGPARGRMDASTAAVVLLHAGLGLLTAAALLPLGVRIRRLRTTQRSSIHFGWWLSLAALLTGCVLLATAARGRVTSGLVLSAHIITGLGSVVILAGYVLRRYEPVAGSEAEKADLASKTGQPHPTADEPTRPRATAAHRATATVILFLLGTLGAAMLMPSGPSRQGYNAEAYYRNLTATNARQAANPLFPAGTSIVEEPGSRWPAPASCGAAGCHPDAYRDWLGSAHQNAGTHPLYRRVAARFEQERGMEARRWCDGCHAPAVLGRAIVPQELLKGAQVLMPGTPATALHRLEGPTEDHRATLNDLSTHSVRPLSSMRSGVIHKKSVLETEKIDGDREGVGCISCHAVQHADRSGNGRMALRVPADYPFGEHPDPRLRWLHDFLIRLRPRPHRQAYARAVVQQSDLCATCHRSSLNLPQNGYKFLRAADDFGTWQTGPHSGESIHGFSSPQPRQRCQDCHSPHQAVNQRREPGHTGVVSTPAERRPPVDVDILVMRLPSRHVGAPEDWIGPLERSAPRLRAGESVLVDVVVSNLASGHQFPSGTGDMKGAWLEFQVQDHSGRVLLTSRPSTAPRSGSEDRLPSLELAAPHWPGPGEHVYGMLALDRAGRRVVQGDSWNMVTPLFHRSILPGQPDADRRTIQPGEADVARYRLRVPRSTSGPLQLRALLWQGYLTQTAAEMAASTGNRSHMVARLLAWDSVSLPLVVNRRPTATEGHGSHGSRKETLASDRRLPLPAPGARKSFITLPERYYAYGVGLLLQGDLPRAQRAMRKVQALAPQHPDGYYGLGRVYLTEGDLLAARVQFAEARRLAPRDPRPQALFAMTERRMGQYDAALTELTRLGSSYPRDRVLWFEIGMCHFLAGRYEEGVRAFETVLDIDPDDLAAHFNLMRCLRRLRRVPEARREEVIYQNLREDDDAKKISLAFLQNNPWADRESRTIHEHPLYRVTSTPP